MWPTAQAAETATDGGTCQKLFSGWCLKVTLDQITFSARLFDLGGLDQRYRRLVADTIDDKRAPELISAVLRHGALERGDAQVVLKTSERTACNTVSKRIAAGYLAATTPRTSVRLAFPLDYRKRLFPNFFGDGDGDGDGPMEHGSCSATIGGGKHGVCLVPNWSTAVDMGCSGSS